jgi:hypothetical protein
LARRRDRRAADRARGRAISYKDHIDGYDLITYLSGNVKESSRKQFIYVDDGGSVAAIRVGDWQAVYLENRAHELQVWREPFVQHRMPLLFNLRHAPFERAQHNSNTYHDWMIDRAFVLGPMQVVASRFLPTLKDYPPNQKPGDWSLASLEDNIKRMTVGRHYHIGRRPIAAFGSSDGDFEMLEWVTSGAGPRPWGCSSIMTIRFARLPTTGTPTSASSAAASMKRRSGAGSS